MLTLEEKINKLFELGEYDRIHIFKDHSGVGRNMSTFSVSQLKEGTPAEIFTHLIDSLLPKPKDWSKDCGKFLIACISYDHFGGSYMPDTEFDQLSRKLADNYADLPPLFKERIPHGNLEAGTTLGLTFTDEEIQYVKEHLS